MPTQLSFCFTASKSEATYTDIQRESALLADAIVRFFSRSKGWRVVRKPRPVRVSSCKIAA